MGRVGGKSGATSRFRTVLIWYTMRGTRISTGLYVYWEVGTFPDSTGDRGPYNGDVTGVCVVGSRIEYTP
jgi:hypothetical protein